MDSLAPPKLPHQGTPGSPSFPITVETPSPYEYPVDLSATSTLPWPLKPMDAFELFWLSKNIDDISKIMELLEPNPLMLQTWSYFGHCQRTARELEKEVQYQKDSAESLLEELRRLGIDEALCPLITEVRRLDRRATRFARPASPSLFDSQRGHPLYRHLLCRRIRPQIIPQKQIWEDHRDRLSLSMMTQPHPPPLRHRLRARHSRNDKGLPNAQVAMFDTNDRQPRIWDLRV